MLSTLLVRILPSSVFRGMLPGMGLRPLLAKDADARPLELGGGRRTTVYLRAAIPFTTVHTYSTKGASEDTASRSTSPWAG